MKKKWLILCFVLIIIINVLIFKWIESIIIATILNLFIIILFTILTNKIKNKRLDIFKKKNIIQTLTLALATLASHYFISLIYPDELDSIHYSLSNLDNNDADILSRLETIEQNYIREITPDLKDKVERYLLNQEYDLAISTIDLYIQQNKNVSNNQLAILYFVKSITFERQEKFSEALDEINTSLALNKTNANYHYYEGTLYLNLDRHENSLSSLKLALENTNSDNMNIKASIYIAISEAYGELGQFKKAMEYLNLAENILKNDESRFTELMSTYIGKMSIYSKMGDNQLALETYENYLEPSISLMICEQKALLHGNLSTVYTRMSNHDKALHYAEMSLRILRKISNPNSKIIGETYNKIGLELSNVNKTVKALEYLHKSLKINILTTGENSASTAFIYNDIAHTYRLRKQLDSTLKYYKLALEKSHKSLPSNHWQIAQIKNNLGAAYLTFKDYTRARINFEESIEDYKNSSSPYHPNSTSPFTNLSILYFYQMEYDSAISLANKSINQTMIIESNENHPTIINMKKLINLSTQQKKNKKLPN
tara:strand:+ start:453 stop:2084 length:1632 start_codon:yes stop_codon:yes gene_type:complete